MNKNQTILVTGASSGIGAAIARTLGKKGYDVAINYCSNREGAECVAEQLARIGVKTHLIQADVSDEAQVVSMFNTLEGLSPLSGLVNNAGVITQLGDIEVIDLDRLQKVFSINVFGSFLCAREAVKRMRTDRGGQGGSIVNISSIAARLGSPGEFLDYAATKGAIDTFTVGLAKEVASVGIRVNGVRPGLIDTEMHAHCGDAERADKLKKNIPMGKVGTVDDIAESVAWLLSDAASYVTGSSLDVSGGR